mmetsp:Transcript_2330/g.6486  ORF Transcript_2330/g.6486 Transcript_2330/m.6486 type:complete len:278 (+) Transcript_2330:66-899(+)
MFHEENRGGNNGLTSFEGQTLILPTVTIGNVGQIALDYLIATLLNRTTGEGVKDGDCIRKVGYIVHDSVLPLVGNNAFENRDAGANGALSLAVEVFQIAAKKITIIQQRSPVRKNENRTYAVDLGRWIKENKFLRVVLLTTQDRALSLHPSLASATVYQWTGVPDSFTDFPSRYVKTLATPEEVQAGEIPPVDGVFHPRGFVAQFVHACEVPSIVLSMFSVESVNNLVEGQQLAAVLASCLSLGITAGENGAFAFVTPPSFDAIVTDDPAPIPNMLL